MEPTRSRDSVFLVFCFEKSLLFDRLICNTMPTSPNCVRLRLILQVQIGGGSFISAERRVIVSVPNFFSSKYRSLLQQQITTLQFPDKWQLLFAFLQHRRRPLAHPELLWIFMRVTEQFVLYATLVAKSGHNSTKQM